MVSKEILHRCLWKYKSQGYTATKEARMEGQVGHLIVEDDMMIVLDECENTKRYLTYEH